MSVQVLCGVPRPEEMVREMYKLLKPGGQMVIYEHVRSDDFLSGLVQNVFNVIWPFMLGGCNLNRPTGLYLRRAGHWEKVELQEPGKEDAWTAIPRVSGVMVKGKG